jgi:asparagine synthase (glutamine-hydrolysing)
VSGIAAVAGGDAAAGARWLDHAAAFLATRGPDARDVRHDGRAGLARTLLATTPEDRGDVQPLGFGEGAWLVADVRLDDRAALVRALQGAGRAARLAGPDAELLLHAYHAWGDAFLEHVAGDFALALWDERTQRLLCARDQLGVVPLHYAQAGGRLLVSNTLATIQLDPEVPDALHEPSIADFLLFGMNMDPATTTFAAIRRVPPGHVLTWEAGRIAVRRYWTMPEPDGFLRLPRPEDYVERFRSLLQTAVDDRLRGADAVVQLSGGLDSTAVAALAAAGPGTLLGLTMAGPDDEEGRFAAMVAEHCGFEREELRLDDYADLDPLAAPTMVPPEPQPYVRTGIHADFARRAGAAARVAFTGLGGDPLLMFVPSWWIDALASGRPQDVAAVWREHRRLSGGRPEVFLRPSLRHWRRQRALRALPHDWLDPGFAERTSAAPRAAAITRAEAAQIGISGMAGSPLWAHLFETMDPGFSGTTLRHRHPFFDLRVVAFAGSLPPVPWFPHKRLLRDAMRGSLPEPVLARPKTPLGRGAGDGEPPAGALELIGAVDAVAAFVRRDRLAAPPASGLALRRTLALAHWLAHWQRPVAKV